MSKDANYSKNYKYRRLPNGESELASSSALNDSDDEVESFELQSREISQRNKQQHSKSNSSTSSTPEKDIIHVRKPIVAGESLASISLKYRVSISELKKVNKIHKDTEFYALSSVKIPVRTNSALLDILNDEIQTEAPCHSKIVKSLEPFNDEQIEALKSSIAKIEARSVENQEEEESLIDQHRVAHHVRLYSTTEDKMIGTCSGADWDLSWWKVLLIGVMFLLGVPIMYYYLYHDHDSNQHQKIQL